MTHQLNALSPDEGLKRLLRGTKEIGVGLVVDRGYVYMPSILDYKGQTLSSVLEICKSLDVLLLWRVVEGRKEYFFKYKAAQDRLVMVENNNDKTLAHNSARIATMIRQVLFDSIEMYVCCMVHQITRLLVPIKI